MGTATLSEFEPSPKYPTGERGADDWKKKWKAGAYDHIDPSYVPGSHEIERGEVTWHDVTKCEKQDPINDVRGRRRPPITKTQAILILVGAIVAACFFIAICVGSVH